MTSTPLEFLQERLEWEFRNYSHKKSFFEFPKGAIERMLILNTTSESLLPTIRKTQMHKHAKNISHLDKNSDPPQDILVLNPRKERIILKNF